MRLGVESLTLRYMVTLAVGYLGYLLVLRVWAARLLRQREESGFDFDLPDIDWPGGGSSGGGGGGVRIPLPRTGGGNYGGGGA